MFQVNENNLEETLRKTDASYVEVYHTNGLFQGESNRLLLPFSILFWQQIQQFK